jgi:hypothetical protein
MSGLIKISAAKRLVKELGGSTAAAEAPDVPPGSAGGPAARGRGGRGTLGPDGQPRSERPRRGPWRIGPARAEWPAWRHGLSDRSGREGRRAAREVTCHGLPFRLRAEGLSGIRGACPSGFGHRAPGISGIRGISPSGFGHRPPGISCIRGISTSGFGHRPPGISGIRGIRPPPFRLPAPGLSGIRGACPSEFRLLAPGLSGICGCPSGSRSSRRKRFPGMRGRSRRMQRRRMAGGEVHATGRRSVCGTSRRRCGPALPRGHLPGAPYSAVVRRYHGLRGGQRGLTCRSPCGRFSQRSSAGDPVPEASSGHRKRGVPQASPRRPGSGFLEGSGPVFCGGKDVLIRKCRLFSDGVRTWRVQGSRAAAVLAVQRSPVPPAFLKSERTKPSVNRRGRPAMPRGLSDSAPNGPAGHEFSGYQIGRGWWDASTGNGFI